jgi:hypothetical protein
VLTKEAKALFCRQLASCARRSSEHGGVALLGSEKPSSHTSCHRTPARSVKHPAAPPPAHVVPQLAGAPSKQLADVGTRWASPNRPAPPRRVDHHKGAGWWSKETVPPRPPARVAAPCHTREDGEKREASTPCHALLVRAQLI